MAARARSSTRSGAPRWREPTRSIPLRWGWYHERLILGGILVAGGAAAIAGSNTWTLWLLALGTVAHVAGWAVLPSAGWRRIAVTVPATIGAWLLLTGPRFLGVLVVAYLAWLLVRHRPPRSYPTVLFVVAGAWIVGRAFPDYAQMPIAFAIMIVVLALSAWAARVLHAAGSGRMPATASAAPSAPPSPPSATTPPPPPSATAPLPPPSATAPLPPPSADDQASGRRIP